MIISGMGKVEDMILVDYKVELKDKGVEKLILMFAREPGGVIESILEITHLPDLDDIKVEGI